MNPGATKLVAIITMIALMCAAGPATASASSAKARPAARAYSARAKTSRRSTATCSPARRATHPARAKGAARCPAAHPRPRTLTRRTTARRTTARHTTEPSTGRAILVSGAPQPRSDTAAVIAAVLATPCQNTELQPEAGNLPQVREAVFCLVNQVRAQHGIAPLRNNAILDRAAEEHGQELVSRDYFAHISPEGLTPVDRIRSDGYIPSPSDGYVIGENLAWGTLSLSTPASIVTAWVGSPGHLANILEANYVDTGIAVVAAAPPSLAEGQRGATYSQEFGQIVE